MISHQLPQPGDGPAPDRPRAYPAHATPHTPLRPMWCCRACGQPWPCPQARLLLKAEYAENQIGLSIYLCGMLYAAARDLYQLHPDDGPAPADLFTRFVAWGPYRRRPPDLSP
ncbi:hypothetical protein [Micromonospora narathiwatensis]|uniref:Flavin reductase n=1 Tax=Micromonospora narathiwatensis TaxID=299146 RepID=A0A1A9ADF1_9ACTN|nr:hypothetical protein [Micromonospora narathiwatensis]SBT54162.1 hypothetical protein GA0070621_5226 [Micromonospora narathiwatensis]